MMFASLAVAAASSLALSANALLVTPSIEAIHGPITAAGAIGVDPLNQVVKLECKGCPFAKEVDGKKTWVQDVDNSLMMKFHVEQSSPEQLQINGVQIYPAKMHVPEPVMASQIESSVSEADFINTESSSDKSPYSSVRLSYEAIVRDIKSVNSKADLITVTFKTLSLDGTSVSNKVDDVKATVIKTPEGKLLIVKVEKAAPSSHEDQCSKSLLCRIKSVLRHRLHGLKRVMRGCGHKLRKMRLHLMGIHRGGHHHHHHMMTPTKAVIAIPVPAAIIEHAHLPTSTTTATSTDSKKPMDLEEVIKDKKALAKIRESIDKVSNKHRVYHHHHEMMTGGSGSWIHTVRRVAFGIFIPILIGVAAGMTASLLGMVVGQLLVMLWRRYYRQGKKYESVAQEEGSETDSESVVSDDAFEEKPFLDEKN
ncbi:MAG: hypothetical protein M1823_005276 [Watsoniomyces obsoletus]|nr:MAG: hypothetical protein M1823_005276 [Watsoniomyces obsoletus]